MADIWNTTGVGHICIPLCYWQIAASQTQHHRSRLALDPATGSTDPEDNRNRFSYLLPLSCHWGSLVSQPVCRTLTFATGSWQDEPLPLWGCMEKEWRRKECSFSCHLPSLPCSLSSLPALWSTCRRVVTHLCFLICSLRTTGLP